MSEWTRQHDAVLAWECEGMRTEGLWSTLPSGRGQVRTPQYSTDLAVCFRAAEEWRKRLNVFLQITISTGRSGNTKADVNVVGDGGMSVDGETERGPMTPSQALAWALYNAVKGTK